MFEHRKSRRNEDVLRVKEGFTEIEFRRYRSASCKNIPCRSVGAEGNAELKRGSMYQSSEEIRKMKKTGSLEERRKIKISPSSDASYSFRNSVTSSGSNMKSASISKPYFESCSSDAFIEICLSSDDKDCRKKDKQLVESAGHDKKRNGSFGCEPIVRPSDDGNDIVENDMVWNLHKSQSAKMEACYSASSSESDSPGSDVGYCESDNGSNAVRLKDHLNLASDSDEVDSLNGSTPLLPANLHPNLEIAAIVSEVPYKNRELEIQKRGQNR
ncbi:hypothetical protein F3Y22_tig00111806pilonHSYRG00017 [Hibiscus syriacus]|uniref:Uncharacterized protein n=1 Tax=Hibiscus syriacus TaxID=106335 RepID=A0A6A2YGG3_HIBSY|nr:hypothetical protein F3Y22_tig00111806pilonHSYRG00017 [Hibiscus syriacus]